MSDPMDRLVSALSSRYAIVSQLGEGGMATVYLADDLKHERKVALKVLKPELAAVVGAERFLTEIKTTANLQHPHILPLFDSGEADGFLYYVMPYVEGESLADRIEREKQLPVAEAVAIATKVAGALQAAHDRGVIHRDIKPANILLGERGEPLVADFGIALAVHEAGGGRLTETGLSLGTPHYMSPEQAAGDRKTDARTDVYALGAVLYEMLTGERPFVGSTAQAVLARILTGELNPVSESRTSVPPNVEATAHTALARLPADRFESAAALVTALGDPSYRGVAVGAGGAGGPDVSGSGRERFWQLATAALAVVAIWLALAGGPEPAPAGFELEADLGVQASPVPGITLGPDGTVVFGAGAREGLRLRRPESSISIRPSDAIVPFRGIAFSPDGRFYVGGTVGGVVRASVVDGRGDVLHERPSGSGQLRLHAWSENGWIYGTHGRPFGEGRDPKIVRLRDDGSVLDTVMDLSRFENAIGEISPLPGGAFLATGFNSDITFVGDTTRILIVDPATGDTATVVERGAHAHWVDTGHIVYLEPSGEVMALPFDPDRRAATAPAFGLDIRTGGWDAAYGLIDVAGNHLAYIRNVTELVRVTALEWLDPGDGSIERVQLPPDFYDEVVVSPRGDRLLIAGRFIGEREHTVHDLRTNRRITLPPSFAQSPASLWSPDGSALVRADGAVLRFVTGPLLDQVEEVEIPLPPGAATGWSLGDWPNPDLILATVGFGEGTRNDQQRDVYALERAGGLWTARPLLEAPWTEGSTRLAPTGDAMTVYAVSDSARLTIVPYPSLGPGPTVKASSIESQFGGGENAWSPGGDALYYRQDGDVMRVEVLRSGGRVTLGERRSPFSGAALLGRSWVGVGPDGRLLTLVPIDAESGLDASEQNRLMLVTGLRERIRRLDPGLGGR